MRNCELKGFNPKDDRECNEKKCPELEYIGESMIEKIEREAERTGKAKAWVIEKALDVYFKWVKDHGGMNRGNV